MQTLDSMELASFRRACPHRHCEIKAGLLTGPWRQECRRSEEAVRQQCLESAGASFGVCQAVCPDNAWSRDGNRDKTSLDNTFNEVIGILSALPPDATPEERRAATQRALAMLKKAGALDTSNGVAFVARFFSTREELRAGQNSLERAAECIRNWAADGATPFSQMDQQSRRDEAALPSLIRARLSRGLDGWFIDDCNGARSLFETRESAGAFLREAEKARLADLLADGEVAPATLLPRRRWPP